MQNISHHFSTTYIYFDLFISLIEFWCDRQFLYCVHSFKIGWYFIKTFISYSSSSQHYKLTSNFVYKISKRKLNLRFLLPTMYKQWTIHSGTESYGVLSLSWCWCSIKEPMQFERWKKNGTNVVSLVAEQCTCTYHNVCLCKVNKEREKKIPFKSSATTKMCIAHKDIIKAYFLLLVLYTDFVLQIRKWKSFFLHQNAENRYICTYFL